MGTTDKDTVIIETMIDAPIGVVWKAWTDAALILHWFGSDPNGKGMKAELDVRAGGSFEITFKNSDESEHTCSGIYDEVEPFGKLTFSWTWKSEPGVESFVTVLLSPDGSGTRMQFRHEHLGYGSQHDYLFGWQGAFSKLDRMLKGGGRLFKQA